MKMKKLLLHICCGPCSTPVIPNLRSEFEVAGFYYNPNIFPETEFASRLDSAKKVAQFNGIKLIVPDHSAVIPAEAGIYINKSRGLDSRFRGNDEKERGNNKRGWKNSNDYESYLRFIGETKKEAGKMCSLLPPKAGKNGAICRRKWIRLFFHHPSH